MMATSIPYFKAFTATQGGADTAAETSITTGIIPGVDYGAWRILAIEFNIKPDVMKAWAAVDSDFTLQLTKRSLSGAIARIVTFADQDLIMAFSLALIAHGTVANWAPMVASFFIELPVPILIYAETLYVQIISTATWQTNVAWGRVIYEPVTLTKDQAFTLLASRP